MTGHRSFAAISLGAVGDVRFPFIAMPLPQVRINRGDADAYTSVSESVDETGNTVVTARINFGGNDPMYGYAVSGESSVDDAYVAPSIFLEVYYN